MFRQLSCLATGLPLGKLKTSGDVGTGEWGSITSEKKRLDIIQTILSGGIQTMLQIKLTVNASEHKFSKRKAMFTNH